MEERLEETYQEEELEVAFPKRRRWGKWVAWLIALIVIAGAVWYGVHYFKTHKTKKATTYMPTAQVTKGTIDVTVSGSGSIQPVNTDTITGPGSGTVQKVLVQKGDKVKKGQVIATLDNSKTQDQINQDQVNLQKDQIDLQQTEDQIKKASDQKSIDTLKISLEKTQLDIQSIKTSIASLQDQMSQTNITAPIAGTVDTINIKDGDTFNNNTQVATITDYSSMEIVTNVDELDISKVKLGQKANVTIDALPNQTFTGTVTDIAKQGTSSNGVATFPVTIQLDSVKNILSGMSAEASIQVQSKQNVLMLPIEAVQTNGNNHYVILASGQAGAQGASSQAGNSQGNNGTRGNGQGGNGQWGNGASGNNQSGRGQNNGSSTNSSGRSKGGGIGQSGFAAKGNSGSSQHGASRHFVPVQVGVHNDNYIEIVSGLSAGDVVQIPIQMSSSTGSQFQHGGGGFGALFGGGGGRAFGGGGGGNRYRGGGSSNRGGN